MEDKDWLFTVLQWVLTGILISVLVGWLSKSRLRARPASEARRLVYPASFLIIGIVSFAVCAGFAVVSNIYSNETTTWWTTAIFVGFAILSASMVLVFFWERYELSDEGLAGRDVRGVRRCIRWSELRSVRYVSSKKSFRLETRSGRVMRVSASLMGLPEFARILLQSAPAVAIETQTLDVLRATAAGELPCV